MSPYGDTRSLRVKGTYVKYIVHAGHILFICINGSFDVAGIDAPSAMIDSGGLKYIF